MCREEPADEETNCCNDRRLLESRDPMNGMSRGTSFGVSRAEADEKATDNDENKSLHACKALPGKKVLGDHG